MKIYKTFEEYIDDGGTCESECCECNITNEVKEAWNARQVEIDALRAQKRFLELEIESLEELIEDLRIIAANKSLL